MAPTPGLGRDLEAVKEKRAVFTDGTLASAIHFMTPLSLEDVLEHLTPQLEAAVEGRAQQRVGAG